MVPRSPGYQRSVQGPGGTGRARPEELPEDDRPRKLWGLILQDDGEEREKEGGGVLPVLFLQVCPVLQFSPWQDRQETDDHPTAALTCQARAVCLFDC